MKNNEAVADEPPSTSSDDAVPEPAVGTVVIAPPEAGARRTALLRSAACSLPLEQLLCGCALNVELLQPDGWCYAPRRWLCAAEPARRAAVRAVLRPLSANRGVGGLRRGTLPGAAQLPIRCFVAARAAARRAACAACCARWAGNSARPGWGAPPAGAQVHGSRRVRLLSGHRRRCRVPPGVPTDTDHGASLPGPSGSVRDYCECTSCRAHAPFPTCCVASQQHTYSQQ